MSRVLLVCPPDDGPLPPLDPEWTIIAAIGVKPDMPLLFDVMPPPSFFDFLAFLASQHD